jgi:hypothetical protein
MTTEPRCDNCGATVDRGAAGWYLVKPMGDLLIGQSPEPQHFCSAKCVGEFYSPK